MLRNTFKLRRITSLLAGLLASVFVLAASPGFAAGAVGDLKFIANAPQTDPFRPLSMTCKEFVPIEDGRGSVNEKALVTRIFGGSLAIMVAVDSLKPTADKFDVVRFDFSGKGQFSGVPAFGLKKIPTSARPNSGVSAFAFGPAVVQVLHCGKKTPVFVEGMCSIRDEQVKTLQVSIGAVAEGACRFGDNVYGVRVIDADGRLGISNAPTAEDMAQDVWSPPGAPELNSDAVDVVAIDTKNKAFRKGVIQAVLGRIAYVGGKWYRVLVSQDGSKISAEEIAAKSGTVSIAHDNWAATLVGSRNVLSIRGGKAPVSVPAGRYEVIQYRQYVTFSGSPRAAVLTVQANPDSGINAPVLNVTSGKASSLKIGSPVIVKTKVDSEGSGYSFGFSLTDVSGMEASISLPGQPAPPTIKVVDSKGRRIHSGAMEYG
jgi:hypothetical protein